MHAPGLELLVGWFLDAWMAAVREGFRELGLGVQIGDVTTSEKSRANLMCVPYSKI
jgi:hypothetical protein